MLNQPMSSPMMKTMLGFFPDDETFLALAAGVCAPACASNTFLATPSEQQGALPAPWPAAPISPAACRVAGVATPAHVKGVSSLVAARKPSIAPSPTHA